MIIIESEQLIIIKSAQLNFLHGSMGCGKSGELVRRFYNCTQDNEIPVLLLKPSIDNRYGKDIIKSRMGTFAPAISIGTDTNIIDLVDEQQERPNIIMLDEVQFLLPNQIEQLKKLADYYGITIDAYGLKLNFRGNLFGEKTGTIKRLLELCNTETYMQSFCACGNDATHIARYKPTTWEIQRKGPEVVIGGNNKYIGLCHRCWEGEFIPRPSRLKIYTSMLNEQLEKGKNVNSSKLIKLRSLIEIEKSVITNDELLRYQQIERYASEKVKELSMRIHTGAHK